MRREFLAEGTYAKAQRYELFLVKGEERSMAGPV